MCVCTTNTHFQAEEAELGEGIKKNKDGAIGASRAPHVRSISSRSTTKSNYILIVSQLTGRKGRAGQETGGSRDPNVRGAPCCQHADAPPAGEPYATSRWSLKLLVYEALSY